MIDTATFQRLRHLKQLGLAHTVYPNATHTRFAHSLGVLSIMSRVLRNAKSELKLNPEREQNLRLAALLHDVGHYPYSHLMERLDYVELTEKRVVKRGSRPEEIAPKTADPYPDHEEFGRLIVTSQNDLIEAIGGQERAKLVADLFTRGETADPQHSNLIHSSLDMDRLDYLVRDARAAGVPYGEIDVNYLVNNVRAGRSGMLGIKGKALTAAEQFLLARYFMHRAVYYHKTVFGLEEAFRQLLRRCRDRGTNDLPANGQAVRKIATEKRLLLEFTDRTLDAVAQKALEDQDLVVNRLARSVVHRIPPKLLREECSLINQSNVEHKKFNACTNFLQRCKRELPRLARDNHIDLKLFLLAEPKEVRLEKRGYVLAPDEASRQPPQGADELIKVFAGEQDAEPQSLVDIPRSMIRQVSNLTCRIVRLYVIEEDKDKVAALRKEVMSWRD